MSKFSWDILQDETLNVGPAIMLRQSRCCDLNDERPAKIQQIDVVAKNTYNKMINLRISPYKCV